MEFDLLYFIKLRPRDACKTSFLWLYGSRDWSWAEYPSIYGTSTHDIWLGFLSSHCQSWARSLYFIYSYLPHDFESHISGASKTTHYRILFQPLKNDQSIKIKNCRYPSFLKLFVPYDSSILYYSSVIIIISISISISNYSQQLISHYQNCNRLIRNHNRIISRETIDRIVETFRFNLFRYRRICQRFFQRHRETFAGGFDFRSGRVD